MHIEDKAVKDNADFQQSKGREALMSWVHDRVDKWEKYRDQRYSTIWTRITKKWNCDPGQIPEDQKGFIRSRLVSPALQQAIEDGAAELEETVLSKEGWFDIDDDYADQQKEDWQVNRLLLQEEMERADVPESLLQIFFVSAGWGTAIGKVVADEDLDFSIKRNPEGAVEAEPDPIAKVSLEPVLPWHFVIDTAVNKHGKAGIEMALGMAHRLPQPLHKIREMQNDEVEEKGEVLVEATYWDVPLEIHGQERQVVKTPYDPVPYGEPIDGEAETVLLTEYHGKVPKVLFDAAVTDSDTAPEEIDTREMVEVIVTYVNDSFLLGARENTNLMGLRAFVAAPWDIVPGSFWGRGAGEKGLPAQQVLDIFLRGQVDAMRYNVYPIMGINALKVPARNKIVWGPGMDFRVNGAPQDAVFPIQMPAPGVGTFQLTGQLERHISQATGITPDAGRGEQTLGGTSAVRGALMKRTNRTIRLLGKNLLSPFVRLYYLMHVELNPDLFETSDIVFRVRTAASLVAREQENQTLVGLLQYMPPNTPAYWALVGMVVENTSAKDKREIQLAIQQTLQQLSQPSPQEQTEAEREQANLQEVQARTQNKRVDTVQKLLDVAQQQNEGSDDARLRT